MADTKRTVLYLDADASALLGTLATDKRRGRYVSDLIRTAAQSPPADRATATDPRRARLAALIAEAAPLAAQLLTTDDPPVVGAESGEKGD